MLNSYTAVALALCLIGTVTSIGFVSVNQQLGDQDPIILAGAYNQSGIALDNSSLFSKLFENNPTPVEFMRMAPSSIFGGLGGYSMNFGGHPKPDKKTKRMYIKLLLRWTVRRINSVWDIKKFLDRAGVNEYVNFDNPCSGITEPCPYWDLRKKQLGRHVENLNDEIAFIEEILKKKECPYLRMKLGLLQRDVDTLNTIIKYIDDHNKMEDDHKDFIELLKHIVCNTLENYKDVERFLRDLLEGADYDLPWMNNQQVSKGRCPYLDLQEKIQWREAVNRADSFGFVYWLNHRHRRDKHDCHRLKRRICGTIKALMRIYRGRRNYKRKEHGKHHHRNFFRSIVAPLFQKAFKPDKGTQS